MLELKNVRFGFPSRPGFLGPISVAIDRGRLWAIVGPNGAGKTTLLRLMAALLSPSEGELVIEGDSLLDLPHRERARRIALVPQHPPTQIDTAVRDVVLLGRFPHRSLGVFESPSDYQVADRAMETTQTLGFADRRMSTLSGGEAQRVHLAAALAQEPRLLLLDEPTASLDLQHQLGIFQILRDRACKDGLAVVVVTHDINLAARYCTDVMLMHEGRCVALGSPGEVLTPDLLEPVYGVELASLSLPGDADPGPPGLCGRRWIVPIGMSDGAPP